MKHRARFWFYYMDSPVRLTLEPGQTLHHFSGGPTDEGWSAEGHRWTFDGHTVTHDWTDDGADCDGRLTRYGQTKCPACELEAGNSLDGVAYPAWRCTDYSERDYAAEAAGY